jgi:hypothetical protein
VVVNLDKLIQAVSRIVFDHRKVWLVVFAILTALFVASASRLRSTRASTRWCRSSTRT